MSMNKTDMVNALCLAHRIVQYEMPPPEKFIRLIYKSKKWKIASRLLLKVSTKKIKRVKPLQQTSVERRDKVPPAGGWNITDTSVTKLENVHESTNTYISELNLINTSYHDDAEEGGIVFTISNQGKDHHHVTDLNAIRTSHLQEPDAFVVTLQTTDDIAEHFYALNQKLGNEGYIRLMEHKMWFDKNMRLSSQV